MNLSVNLVITSLKNKQPVFVLSKDNNLPTDVPVYGFLADVAPRLLKTITGVEAYNSDYGTGWAIVRLSDVCDTQYSHVDGEVFIIYSVILPEAVKLAEGWEWQNMTVLDKLGDSTKNIVLKVLNNL